MKKLFLSSTLLFVLALCSHSFAQSEGSILIIPTSTAMISVDGENKEIIEANKPFKLALKIGEHYIQAEGTQNGQKVEANSIVTIESNNQKILKLELKPVAEQRNSSNSLSIEPVSVADLNFAIPGSIAVGLWISDNPNKEYPNNPNYYYAFEKGDEIVIDCWMTNAKGTNILTVSNYPGKSVKYSNKAFAELKDVRIKVEERGIYRFSLATNHAFDRNGKMTIKRIPSSEGTKSFNPTVTKKKIYTVKTIQSPQEFYINSGRNATFQGGKSRLTFPVNFPKNTVEWYYTFAASRDESKIKQTKQSLNLTGDLTKLLIGGVTGGILSIGINQLIQPPGSDYCDVYILDKNNFNPFEAKINYQYIAQGSRENFKSGIVQMKSCMNDTYYIGIKNPDAGYGINVVIEVAAIVSDVDWVMAEQ